MLEMMALIQDFRSMSSSVASYISHIDFRAERTTGKNNSKSAAFTAKKNALYTKARENSSNAVRDGVAYMSGHDGDLDNPVTELDHVASNTRL